MRLTGLPLLLRTRFRVIPKTDGVLAPFASVDLSDPELGRPLRLVLNLVMRDRKRLDVELRDGEQFSLERDREHAQQLNLLGDITQEPSVLVRVACDGLALPEHAVVSVTAERWQAIRDGLVNWLTEHPNEVSRRATAERWLRQKGHDPAAWGLG